MTLTGTAYALKKDRPYELPVGTKMKSRDGITFSVTSCTLQNEYHYAVTGSCLDTDVPDELQTTVSRIQLGFTWPDVEFEVVDMPGFVDPAPLTHVNQVVDPPLRAWIHSHATDAGVVYRGERRFCLFNEPNAVSLSSKRMQGMHIMSRNVCRLHQHAEMLKRSKTEAVDMDVGKSPYDIKTDAFLDMAHELRSEIDHAQKFESDLVKHINPQAGKVDLFFVFPLSPHEEVSYKGMKMVFKDVAESFQLIRCDNEGRTSLLTNAGNRRLSLLFDQLTAKNWRGLEYQFTKQLTQMGTGKSINAVLKSLKQFTTQHDYRHEVRMHWQDAVYRVYYGGYLRAIQIQMHIGYKGITGEPSRTMMQTHEQLLRVNYIALDDYRTEMFIEPADITLFQRVATESNVDLLERIESAHTNYCQSLQRSDDEPTRMIATHMKVMESYWRSVHAVANHNAWLGEQEAVDRLGGWKLVGKGNYVSECLHRNDVMYGPDMPNHYREWIRHNCIWQVTHSGKGVSPDHMNEVVNL